MLIPASQEIGPINSVTYTIDPKYFTSDPKAKTYGQVYADLAKPGFKPVITVKYDESKPLALRGLVSFSFDLGERTDGSTKKVTVNFTEVFPSDASDSDVEFCIAFVLATLGLSDFATSFVDRVA